MLSTYAVETLGILKRDEEGWGGKRKRGEEGRRLLWSWGWGKQEGDVVTPISRERTLGHPCENYDSATYEIDGVHASNSAGRQKINNLTWPFNLFIHSKCPSKILSEGQTPYVSILCPFPPMCLQEEKQRNTKKPR